VVFVDELNRTRPDLQNKLFPIIHERRVQGVELEKLRYRWAAMNPATKGDNDNEEQYLGAEPLDPALADRFGFLIEVPDWCDLSEAERTEVLLDQFRGPHEFPDSVYKQHTDACGRPMQRQSVGRRRRVVFPVRVAHRKIATQQTTTG
jgi:MoxR-like ATPase